MDHLLIQELSMLRFGYDNSPHLDHKTLDVICQVQPSKIAYLSCNPSTMLRDIKYLIEACHEAPFFDNPDMGKEIAKIFNVIQLFQCYYMV